MANQTSHPTALISVTNKSGLIEFAKGLLELNFKIVATGGTYKHLLDAGITATEVSAMTNCPEVLGGRVKTLHPAIHGGILADRSITAHQNDLDLIKSCPIDLVIVNLYNFQKEAKQAGLPLAKGIEHIDVGGPAMLRAAAKNHQHCLPIVDPDDYRDVLDRLKHDRLDSNFRAKMAAKVFKATSSYDLLIAEFFDASLGEAKTTSPETPLPQILSLQLVQHQPLRYGENAHQTAAVYTASGQSEGIIDAQIIQGKELSYNNYLDIDAASGIITDLSPTPAMTIIKHTNPCGTAAGLTLSPKELFLKALASDPKCAFGGIVASNVEIDESSALMMAEIFLECIIAPSFTDKALAIFRNKKNLRILKSASLSPAATVAQCQNVRSIKGGYLVQTSDSGRQETATWQCVSKLRPDVIILNEMAFAMSVCKHVKSNAIVLSSNQQTIGIGAGQMSRVDSVKIAIGKARELGHVVRGAVMASDAFFPFRDCVDEAAKAGITAIVQPGGSIRDAESNAAANEHGMIMVVTGMRHFKH
jgi:phosphoribosylaminoimidazolecarboxamide formyltransferase/IMP cyclohydrolase